MHIKVSQSSNSKIQQLVDESSVSSENCDEAEGSAYPKILVVDDCMINIMAVTSMLNGLGFECDSCTDGEQAVEAVKDRYMDEKATMYDLIFMDFSMPYCDGCEATK